MSIKDIIVTVNQMQADNIIGQYAIGGAVAAAFYLEPAATKDVDVFVSIDPPRGQSLVSLDPIYRYLEARDLRTDDQGNLIISGWPVQFLAVGTPLDREALDQAVKREVDGEPVRILGAEHLAAIAFHLGRPKDKLRVIQFLEAHVLDDSKFSAILERHDLLDRWIRFKRQISG